MNGRIGFDDDIYYTASLMVYIGRHLHQKVGDVVRAIGIDDFREWVKSAPVMHCLVIEQSCHDVVEVQHLTKGSYQEMISGDHVMPDHKRIGKSYARLVEKLQKEEDSPFKGEPQSDILY